MNKYQPWYCHKVPESWVNALRKLSENMNDPKLGSPFENTGRRFDCQTFSVHAYSWDENEDQQWNFKWRDVEISWYKYLGRGMSSNLDLSNRSPDEMLKECSKALTMGMFDSVIVGCPNCDNDIEFQSKAGDCSLHNYSINNVPVSIAADLNGSIECCNNCHKTYKFRMVLTCVIEAQ